MKRLILLLLVLTVSLTSCKKEVIPPEEPPPPSVGEIRSALDSSIQGIKSGDYGDKEKDEAIEKIVQAEKLYGSDPNWEEAHTGFADSVWEMTKSIRDTAITDGNDWPKVAIWAEVLKAVAPDYVPPPPPPRPFTELKVSFKGILNDTIFVDIKVPGETKTYQEIVRVGQEIHGIKIVEMIDSGKGIVIEYLETGERKEVMLGQ